MRNQNGFAAGFSSGNPEAPFRTLEVPSLRRPTARLRRRHASGLQAVATADGISARTANYPMRRA
jgi:hypothetical protein